MTTETTQATPQLVRGLKLRDLILFNLVAVLGLRHLGTTAKFGPGSLLMWLIAAIFFFIPQGLAVIELSSRFPKEGGIYFWTKSALGEGHGKKTGSTPLGCRTSTTFTTGNGNLVSRVSEPTDQHGQAITRLFPSLYARYRRAPERA